MAKELEDTILKNGPENIAAFVGETMLGSLRGIFHLLQVTGKNKSNL